MLHVINKNKPSKNSQCELSWHQIFRDTEDTLTSFVFERLFYLPVDLMWRIIRESCFSNDYLPRESGMLLDK